jgi:hypothetical protein
MPSCTLISSSHSFDVASSYYDEKETRKERATHSSRGRHPAGLVGRGWLRCVESSSSAFASLEKACEGEEVPNS